MRNAGLQKHLVVIGGVLVFGFLALGSNTLPYKPSPGTSLQQAQRTADQSIAMGLVYYDQMPGRPDVSRYITGLQSQDLKNRRIRKSQLDFLYFENDRMLSQQEVDRMQAEIRAEQEAAFEERKRQLAQQESERTQALIRAAQQQMAAEKQAQERVKQTKSAVEAGARKAQQPNPSVFQQPNTNVFQQPKTN